MVDFNHTNHTKKPMDTMVKTVQIRQDLHKELKQKALDEGITFKQLLEQIIIKFLKK